MDTFVLVQTFVFFGVLLGESLPELENVFIVAAGEGGGVRLKVTEVGELGVGTKRVWHVGLGQFYLITIVFQINGLLTARSLAWLFTARFLTRIGLVNEVGNSVFCVTLEPQPFHSVQ